MKKLLFILLTIGILISLVSCKGKQKLYLYNWTDYISLELLREFENEYNCRVVLDTYSSNETMYAKLLISKSAYDIIVPSSDYLEILREDGLLEKIDLNLLENYKNLNQKLLSSIDDHTADYGIPYFWGTSGIIYNRDKISDEEMEDVSWNIFADERFNNKRLITLLDDMREVIGSALILNGFDPNDYNDENLLIAKQTLNTWKKNIAQYDSDSYKNEVQDGTIWLGQAYNGDALQVMDENDAIGFALPIEGSTLWMDYLCIPKNSENKDLALKFIDFLLRADVAKENAEEVMYATPNLAAYQLLDQETKDNELIYPPDEYLSKCYFLKKIDEGILKFDEVWQELRN